MSDPNRIIAITCLAASLVSAGCALPRRFTTTNSTAGSASTPSVDIVYATASDRLNVASASGSSLQPVGHGGIPSTTLPSATNGVLRLIHPHPLGNANLAQAVLTFHVGSDGPALEEETRWLNLPAWQLSAILSRLEEEKFFRRSRVPSPAAELSVSRHGSVFAKPFRAIPELDALMLRVRQAGQPHRVAQLPQAAGWRDLSRLPSVE